MSEPETQTIRSLLERAGLGWAVLWFRSMDPELAQLRDTLQTAHRDAVSRNCQSFPTLTDLAQRPGDHKTEALLQALCSGASPPMLVMTWRVLQGWRIAEVSLTYVEEKDFRLRICVKPRRDAEESETYESTDIHDASLLRHFGVLSFDGRPVLDGFYPLKTADGESP